MKVTVKKEGLVISNINPHGLSRRATRKVLLSQKLGEDDPACEHHCWDGEELEKVLAEKRTKLWEEIDQKKVGISTLRPAGTH